ncbi:MAG: hypothetical protein CME70_06310 [Halobacteriovorax sp.]|nr:hypothetical protein [Halobacteriovorax sp.]|tara:strand:+ start:10305 stop:17390 length:7086 start_codon:yes stop_codon:yes gene_type:complete
MPKIYLTGSGPSRGYVTGSGVLNNPPRTILRAWDSATGSYPTVMRTNPSGRLGTHKSTYDDTSAIIFNSSYSTGWIKFTKRPSDASTIVLTDSLGNSETFETQRGIISELGNIVVDIRDCPDLSSIHAEFAREISSSSLKIHAYAKKDRIELRHSIPGEYSTEITATSNTNLEISNSQSFLPGDAFSITGSFVSPSPGHIVRYPTKLHEDSSWTDHRIASPSLPSDLTSVAITPKGIADVELTFTPGENLGAFDDSLLKLSNDDEFFDEGVSKKDLEGFSGPLKSKTQIVIEMDCQNETSFGLDDSTADGSNPGIRFHNMVYYNFETNQWEKQGTGINIDGASGPAGGWADDKAYCEDFMRDGCIGFSRGLELLESGSLMSSRPISNFGFPAHPKFAAQDGKTFKMSSVINKPFLLEKFTIEFDSEWYEGDDVDPRAVMYSVDAAGNISNETDTYKNNKAVINNFFILNQRPWAGDYSFKTKVYGLDIPDGGANPNDPSWEDGDVINLSGQIPDFARVGIEDGSGVPDTTYEATSTSDIITFEAIDVDCADYPDTAPSSFPGPWNIIFTTMPVVGGSLQIDGNWAPDISGGTTLTIQVTNLDNNGALVGYPTLEEIKDWIETICQDPAGNTGTVPMNMVFDPSASSKEFNPPTLLEYYDYDFITLSCYDYTTEYVDTIRELVTYGQVTGYADIPDSVNNIHDILETGLKRELVVSGSDISGDPLTTGDDQMMVAGRHFIKGICQRPGRFQDGHAYAIGTKPVLNDPVTGIVAFQTSHTGVRTGLENELSTARAFNAATPGTTPISSTMDMGTVMSSFNDSASTGLIETKTSQRLRPHSPYVLLPGDKLVFGFQAACPYMFARSADMYNTGPHMILAPGATPNNPSKIKITLYGSLVSDKREKHDSLNQPLTTDAVHEALQYSTPVVDQFDVDNLGYHAENYLDDIVAGDMQEIGPYPSVTELFFHDYNIQTGLDSNVTRNCVYITAPDLNKTATIAPSQVNALGDPVGVLAPESDPDCTSSRLLFEGTTGSFTDQGKNLFATKPAGAQWTLPYRPITSLYPSLASLEYLDESRISAEGGAGSSECGICGGVDLVAHDGSFDLSGGSGLVTSTSDAVLGGAVNYRTGDFNVRFDGVLQGPRERVTSAEWLDDFLMDQVGSTGFLNSNLKPNPIGWNDVGSTSAMGDWSVYAFKIDKGPFANSNSIDQGIGPGPIATAGNWPVTGSHRPIRWTHDQHAASVPGADPDSLWLNNAGYVHCYLNDTVGEDLGVDCASVICDASAEVFMIPGPGDSSFEMPDRIRYLPNVLNPTYGTTLDSTQWSEFANAKTKLVLDDLDTGQLKAFAEIGYTGCVFGATAIISGDICNPELLITHPGVASFPATGQDFNGFGTLYNPFDPASTYYAESVGSFWNLGTRRIRVPLAAGCVTSPPISPGATLSTFFSGPQVTTWSREQQTKTIFYSLLAYQQTVAAAVASATSTAAANDLCTWFIPYDFKIINSTNDGLLDTIVFESWFAGDAGNVDPLFLATNFNNTSYQWSRSFRGTANDGSINYNEYTKCSSDWPGHATYFSSTEDNNGFTTSFIGGRDPYYVEVLDNFDHHFAPTKCIDYVDIVVRPSPDPEAVYYGDHNKNEYWDGTSLSDPALNNFTFRIYFNDFTNNYMSYIEDPALPPTTGGGGSGIIMADTGGTNAPNYDGGIHVTKHTWNSDNESVNTYSTMWDDTPLTANQLSKLVYTVLSNPQTRIRTENSADPYTPGATGWKQLGDIFAWHRLSFKSTGGQIKIFDEAGVLGDLSTDIEITAAYDSQTLSGHGLSDLITSKQLDPGDEYVQGITYFDRTRRVRYRASGSGFLPGLPGENIDIPYPGTQGSFSRNVKHISDSDRFYDTVTPSPSNYHKRNNKELMNFFGTHLAVGQPNPADNGPVVPEQTRITCGPESSILDGHSTLNDGYETSLEGCWFTIYDGDNRAYNIWYDIEGRGSIGIPPPAPSQPDGTLVKIEDITQGANKYEVAEKTAAAINALDEFIVEYEPGLEGSDSFLIRNTSTGAATDVTFPGVEGHLSLPDAALPPGYSPGPYIEFSPQFIQYGAPGGAGASEDGTGPQTDGGQVVNNTSTPWKAETLVQGISSYHTSMKDVVDDGWLGAYPFEKRYSGMLRTVFSEDETDWKSTPQLSLSNAPTGIYGSSDESLKFTTMFVTGSRTGLMPNPWGPSGPNYGAQGFISDTDGNIMFGDTQELDNNIYKFYFGSGNGWVHSPILSQSATWRYIPEIRGWKYGLISALPLNSNAVFRSDTFGQYRDMIEQRLDARLFITTGKSKNPVTAAPVTCKFINPAGDLLDPILTQAQNISSVFTSSLPYFDDGIPRNR